MTTFMTHNGFRLTKVKSNNNKNNGTEKEHKNHFGHRTRIRDLWHRSPKSVTPRSLSQLNLLFVCLTKYSHIPAVRGLKLIMWFSTLKIENFCRYT